MQESHGTPEQQDEEKLSEAIAIVSETLFNQIPANTPEEIDHAIQTANAQAYNAARMIREIAATGNPGAGKRLDDKTAEDIAQMMLLAVQDPAAFSEQHLSEKTDKAAGPSMTGRTAPDPGMTIVRKTITASVMSAPAIVQRPETAMPHFRMIKKPIGAIFPDVPKTHSAIMIPCGQWPDGEPEDIPERDPHYRFNQKFLPIIASALTRKIPAIAVGDPGCGKTEFFRQLAAVLRMRCTIIPVDGSLRRSDLIGSFRQISTPNGSETPFIDGLIPREVGQPNILVFDEIDQADPDIHYALHRIYEGHGILIQEDGGRYVARHPHCYVFATANTKGRGSDNGLTNARNEMSEATRDRFPYWLEFTYLDSEQEADIITAKTGLPAGLARKLVQIANGIRNAFRAGSMAQPCSTRQLLNAAWLAMDLNTGDLNEALVQAFEIVVVGRANSDDRMAITDLVFSALNIEMD